MKSLSSLAALSAVVVLLSACSSAPKATAPVSTPVASTPAPAPAAPAAQPQSAVAQVVVPDYLDPNNPLSKDRSVFFAYDDFSVASKYQPVVERHGKYLAQHASVQIRVEGNADERGSSEYNLALGQKRAEATVRALRVYGVKDSQLEAVSWGKEKPRAQGHDEAAWAENRRVDLAYPSR
ncbi:MAG: peptidoglycan-associated lipoprotein Pal [Curvibacter lanceolatus]|jgi:peptidoglycan-associated lipoprotein|uniref:peptidoglycan-associated lipoprotein Pal n=1 Tax=Curvibacter lanceolatus TaxID=86182 RepID=UPI0003A7F175|nr:peptidoglycan-associated lipoprotein Pal [Curvibacter lanceolatus]MBV5293523.1 peptidoglycan-associated lipoprotein Pal [Curvibacter lanceolatus]